MKSRVVSLLAFAPFFVFPTMPPMPTLPPCFPFVCPSPTPTVIPTNTPTPTPTVQATPSPSLIPVPSITPTPTPTATPSSQILQGAFVGSQPYNLNDIQNFENMSGKKLSVVMWYQSFGVTDGTQYFQKSWMDLVDAHGSVPMVTLEPWNYLYGTWQTQYRLSQIYNGAFDSLLTKWAQDSKAWGKTYYLRFAHEMNGNWYPWSEQVNFNRSGDYVKAWKHVVDIFRREGASNVKFVWCPNVNYQGSTPLTQLFPGDSYIDYTCMDGYNWGNTNGGWQSFTTLFKSTYDQLAQISSKPVIIGETASAEQGGSKANWITNGYGSEIDTMPRIMLINWFNQNKEKDWRINSSASSQNAFRNAIANPKYK